MNRSAWIIRLAKINGNWRALQPVYTTHRGKEVLSTTQVVPARACVPRPFRHGSMFAFDSPLIKGVQKPVDYFVMLLYCLFVGDVVH